MEKILAKYHNYKEYDKAIFEHHANSHFDQLTDPENRNLISIRQINSDIENLNETAKDVCDYADKNVAHIEESKTSMQVTLKKILESIELLKSLTDKYLMILKDEGFSNEKLVNSEWKNCFNFAWNTEAVE